MGLRRKEITPEELLVTAFQRSRGGSPTFVQLSMAQRLVILHLGTIARNVAQVDPSLAEQLQTKVADKLSSPSRYDEAFPAATVERAAGDEGGEGDDDPEEFGGSGVQQAESGHKFLDDLASGAPRGVQLLAELYKKAYDGTYDEIIAKLADHKEPTVALASEDPEVLGNFSKDLKDGDVTVRVRSLLQAL